MLVLGLLDRLEPDLLERPGHGVAHDFAVGPVPGARLEDARVPVEQAQPQLAEPDVALEQADEEGLRPDDEALDVALVAAEHVAVEDDVAPADGRPERVDLHVGERLVGARPGGAVERLALLLRGGDDARLRLDGLDPLLAGLRALRRGRVAVFGHQVAHGHALDDLALAELAVPDDALQAAGQQDALGVVRQLPALGGVLGQDRRVERAVGVDLEVADHPGDVAADGVVGQRGDDGLLARERGHGHVVAVLREGAVVLLGEDLGQLPVDDLDGQLAALAQGEGVLAADLLHGARQQQGHGHGHDDEDDGEIDAERLGVRRLQELRQLAEPGPRGVGGGPRPGEQAQGRELHRAPSLRRGSGGACSPPRAA